jgi:[acyl-carrier-protein] S-malonyltransferase
MLHRLPLAPEGPRPPVFSLTTGKIEYNDHNTRTILNRWSDHPQLLWEAVFETLSMGANLMVHVGPEPNLIPATFRRIADNVQAQMNGRSPRSLGLRAVSSMWRPWVAKWVSSRSALLRAPLVEHVILEDWLLASAPSKRGEPSGALRMPST